MKGKVEKNTKNGHIFQSITEYKEPFLGDVIDVFMWLIDDMEGLLRLSKKAHRDYWDVRQLTVKQRPCFSSVV